MKKLLLITFVFCVGLCANTQAQTIDSIANTGIPCFGDQATITVFVDSAGIFPDSLQYVVWYTSAVYTIYDQSNYPTDTFWTFTTFVGNTDYDIYIVDQTWDGATAPSIMNGLLDSTTINFPAPLVEYGYSNIELDAVNDCPNSCDGNVLVDLEGGTTPYTYIHTDALGNSSAPTSIASTGVLLNILCNDSNLLTFTDANGCIFDTTIFVAGPSLLDIDVDTTMYNGAMISCIGADDGEIIGNASGGNGGFEYTIIDTNAINFGPGNTFSPLAPGDYKIYYKDIKGCMDSSGVITIFNPDTIAGTLAVTDTLECNSACDAEVTFTIDPNNQGTPGSPPNYTYTLLNTMATNSTGVFGGRCAGTDTVVVQDANGCPDTATVVITEPDSITKSVSTFDYNGFGVSCNGSDDGIITVNSAFGGTPPYTYWIDGVQNAPPNNTIFDSLSANTYVIGVEDSKGCFYDTTITITEPPIFDVSLSSSKVGVNGGFDVSCPDTCDGIISVDTTAGVGSINFVLDAFPVQTDTFWTNLCGEDTYGGKYYLTATDANGCVAEDSIALVEPADWVWTMDSTNESCNQGNGSAEITIISGGNFAGGYFYLWSNGDNTANASSLDSNIHYVTVTDNNTCSLNDSVLVGNDVFSLVMDYSPACVGSNNGKAIVSPSGVSPYDVTWSLTAGGAPIQNNVNVPISDTLYNLGTGWYHVSVTDDSSCVASDSVEIISAVPVSIALDVNNSDTVVDCFGDNSTLITVIGSGGTGPSTYMYYVPGAFPTPQALNEFSGLFPTLTDSMNGNIAVVSAPHQVVVVDFNSCTDTLDVDIHQPEQITFSTGGTNLFCNGDNSGTAFVAAGPQGGSGTGTYNYTWNTGSTSSLITGLSAGSYWVSVSDNNGCLSNPLADTVIITEPASLTSTITINSHSHCTGSQALATGDVLASIGGGTPGYTYEWYNYGVLIPGANTAALNTLMPAEYQLKVEDDNNCIKMDTVVILPGTNPTLNAIITNVSCFDSADGSITTGVDTTFGGTAPYTFDLNSSGIFDTLGYIYDSLIPAYYNLKVVDALGCTDEMTYQITQPDVLFINSFTSTNALCFDSANGTMTVGHLGGTPAYTYQWINTITGVLPNDSLPTATNLDTGSYYVVVTDTNGCLDTSSTITITEPDSLYFDTIIVVDVSCFGGADGYATVQAAGGSGSGYTYLWSNGITNNTTTNDTAGVYTVTVTDGSGCSRTATVTIGEPSPLNIQLGTTTNTCKGGSDGEAYLVSPITGGYGPTYTLQWENGSIIDTAYNLPAGWQTLIVNDSTCVYIDSVYVDEPAIAITIDTTYITGITCHDANNGAIQITASSGVGAYLYSISDTAHGGTTIYPLQLTTAFTSLSGGAYTVYVQDVLGCFTTQIDTVINPDSIYIDTVYFDNVSCYGAYDGKVTGIDAVGGTLPYEYSVNGSTHHPNMAYFNNYGPGLYTVEVFDANNCSNSFIILIEEPDELDVTTTTTNYNGYEISCNGTNSGGIGFDVLGGLTPYNYEAVNAAGTLVASTAMDSIGNLFADPLYTFTVTDGNGCTYSEAIEFKEPDAIQHNFIATHVSCTGWNNGSLIDSVYGGVGNSSTYSYSWNTGDITYSINNLIVGTYTMTVVDENNCTSIDSYTINDDIALAVSISTNTDSTNDVSCWNNCDGLITVNVTGGAPNFNSSGVPVYMYQWNDILAQTTATAIGLCVDSLSNNTTYSCVITDAQGCQDSIDYVLSQPDEFVVSPSIDVDISCNGDADGELSATTVGGNGGVLYAWNNGITTASNTNLATGTYVVLVSDAKGCKDTAEIFLPEPDVLTDIVTITDLNCFEDASGEINAVASGGSPIFPNFQYDYTFYEVVNGNNVQVDNQQQTTATATGLSVGTYIVIVEDDHGCKDTSNAYYIDQPANPLSINVDSTDETCKDKGTATAYVSGGTQPYAYVWSNGSTGNGSIFDTILELSPGIYTVDVTDDKGCTISSGTEVIGYRNIFLPGNLNEIDSTVCLGSSVAVDVEEMAGFTYTWTYNNDTIANGADIILTPEMLLPQVNRYILNIVDPLCVAPYTVEARISVYQVEPKPMATPAASSGPYTTILKGESVTISAENYNCDNYLWTWDEETDSVREFDHSPLKSTTYYVGVDSASCLGFDTIYVVVGVKPYDAITPNGDDKNDVWNVVDIASYPDATVQVFNRWGLLVFDAKGGNGFTPWDGTSAGKELPVGTYYYVIDLNNGDDPQTGPITIVR